MAKNKGKKKDGTQANEAGDATDITKFHSKNQPPAQPGAEGLAKEINADWRAFAQDTMARAWDIGVKLAKLKGMVRPEAWEKWCAGHLDFGFRHIQKLVLIGSLPQQPKLLKNSNTVLNIDELASLANKVAKGEDYPKLLAATLEGKVLEKVVSKDDDDPKKPGPVTVTRMTHPVDEDGLSREKALAIIGIQGANVFVEPETLGIIFAGLKKARKKASERDELKEAEEVLT